MRVLPDYHCHAVWTDDEDGPDNVSPHSEKLSLSTDLAVALDGWADEYTATLCDEDPIRSGFATPESERDFARRGFGLARRVRASIGPEWTVTYYDVSTTEHTVIDG